jgi:hypothetical protein
VLEPEPDQRSRDRHVDHEQPAPTPFEQHPAEQWAHEEGYAEHRADQAEHPTTLFCRHRFRDHGARDREDAAGPECLERTPGEQQPERRGKGYPQRAGRKQRETAREQGTAAAAIGQLREQRRADQIEQHVDAEYPLQRPAADAVVLADGRERRTDDCDIEGGHEHAREQDRENHRLRPRVHLVGSDQQSSERVAEQRAGSRVTVIDPEERNCGPGDDLE